MSLRRRVYGILAWRGCRWGAVVLAVMCVGLHVLSETKQPFIGWASIGRIQLSGGFVTMESNRYLFWQEAFGSPVTHEQTIRMSGLLYVGFSDHRRVWSRFRGRRSMAWPPVNFRGAFVESSPVSIALWVPIIPLSGIAIAGWRVRRCLNRLAPLRCGTCDYDLAGLHRSAPCPECGAAAPGTPQGASTP